jgi:hypothetical protein
MTSLEYSKERQILDSLECTMWHSIHGVRYKNFVGKFVLAGVIDSVSRRKESHPIANKVGITRPQKSSYTCFDDIAELGQVGAGHYWK